VRLSPHFYSREEECDLAIAQIAEILETRAWEKHSAALSHA
jgi:selenocysteine lyase/cysteine desulfurase